MDDLPKTLSKLPAVSNTGFISEYRLMNYLKYHYGTDGGIHANPMFSVDFDIDYSSLPQILVVGDKRWDVLFRELYGQTWGWQFLAYLNNVTDPFTQKPRSGDYIYYLDPSTMGAVVRSLKESLDG